MAKTNTKSTKGVARKPRPAFTPEARENQLISLAVDQVEQELLAGTASSQVLTHFLKLASQKNQLELEKLKNENELLKAKRESLESSARIEAMYAEAMRAMSEYRGNSGPCDA